MNGEHIHVRTDERGVDHCERTEIVRGYVDRRRASGETRDGCEPARVDADRLDESRHGDRANRGIDCKWLNDNEQVGKVAAGRGDAMTARDERRSVERLFRLFLYFLLFRKPSRSHFFPSGAQKTVVIDGEAARPEPGTYIHGQWFSGHGD